MSREYYDTLTQPESYAETCEGFGTVILPGEVADGISVYEIAELCYNDPNVSQSVKEYLLENVVLVVDPDKYFAN